MAARDLVRWMEDKRRALGLSHVVFVQRLGLSLTIWGYYRTGERSPGLRTLRRLLREWPEDRAEILAAVEAAPLPDEPDGDE